MYYVVSCEKEHREMPYRTRHTLRKPSFDYRSSGAYFVTICTQKRHPYFVLPALRDILEEQWQALPTRYPNVTLDSFVIMPDHIHYARTFTN